MPEQISMIDNLKNIKPDSIDKEYRNYLSLSEVGKLLGVTWQTVRNYVKQNKLKAIMLNNDRDYRISPDDLCEFILARKTDKSLEAADQINSEIDDIQYNRNTKNCVLNYADKSNIKDIFSDVKGIELFQTEKNNDYKYLNSIFMGDNILILNKLLEDFKGKVDLIYIDPPFGTNQDFITYNGVTAYGDKVTNDVFLEFIRKRLYYLKEFLSERGSIYVHIDKKMGHYVKVILDEVFGEENYINEITRIKCNPKNFSRKAYGNYSDTIFLYAKKKDKNIWNDVRIPLTDDEIKTLFPKINDKGERYTTNPLHAPGETKDGPTGQMWKGMYPPKGRHWRYNPDVLTELDNKGLIEWSSTGNPRKIIFAKDHEGKKVQDIWEFKDKGNSNSSYPTEKNRQLLSFILMNSSMEGSIVMDAFMGSGSFLIEADKLKRKFIGIDSSKHAVDVCLKLMKDNKVDYNFYKIKE